MVIPAMFVIFFFPCFLRYMGIRLMSYIIDVGLFIYLFIVCGRNVISQNRSKM